MSNTSLNINQLETKRERNLSASQIIWTGSLGVHVFVIATLSFWYGCGYMYMLSQLLIYQSSVHYSGLCYVLFIYCFFYHYLLHVNFMYIRWCLSHKVDFLLSVGGAMTMNQYWHVDVFRPGLQSNMRSLRQTGQCTFELQLHGKTSKQQRSLDETDPKWSCS